MPRDLAVELHHPAFSVEPIPPHTTRVVTIVGREADITLDLVIAEDLLHDRFRNEVHVFHVIIVEDDASVVIDEFIVVDVIEVNLIIVVTIIHNTRLHELVDDLFVDDDGIFDFVDVPAHDSPDFSTMRFADSTQTGFVRCP